MLFYILSFLNKDTSIIRMQILQSFPVLFLLLSLLLLVQLPSGFPHSLKSRFLSLLLNIFLPQSVRLIKGRPVIEHIELEGNVTGNISYFHLSSQSPHLNFHRALMLVGLSLVTQTQNFLAPACRLLLQFLRSDKFLLSPESWSREKPAWRL